MIHEEQNICIVNGGLIELDANMLAACLAKCAQQLTNSQYLTAEIHTNARDANGWLEYRIIFRYTDGRAFVIGAIQRQPGAEYEFHS